VAHRPKFGKLTDSVDLKAITPMRRNSNRDCRPALSFGPVREAIAPSSASINPGTSSETAGGYENAQDFEPLHRPPSDVAQGNLSDIARLLAWLAECYRRSRDRHYLSQLDRQMRADLGQDRVQAELAKRCWRG
jgi:hypothetical protein